MAKPKNAKKNITVRMSLDLIDHAHKLAENSGQSIAWWIENTLGTAWGLQDWPKQPKKAKELKPNGNADTL